MKKEQKKSNSKITQLQPVVENDKNILEEISEMESLKETLKKEIEDRILKFEDEEFEFATGSNLVPLEKALEFLFKFSNWKYTEIYYVQKCVLELREKIKKEKELIHGLSEGESHTIKLNNRILDTLNFFLEKVSGVGMTKLNNTQENQEIDFTVEDYITLFENTQRGLTATKPFRDYLELSKLKVESIDHAMMSVQHGVALPVPIKEQLLQIEDEFYSKNPQCK